MPEAKTTISFVKIKNKRFCAQGKQQDVLKIEQNVGLCIAPYMNYMQ
jgi:hypothetical protein